MADNNFPACLAFVLKAEGGWSDNPNDPGGCTMYGITLASYRAWKNNPSLTSAQLYVISSPEVTAFYREQYWTLTQADKLPSGVDLMVMDEAVNSGVNRSARLLQEQVGVVIDGHIGALTVHAASMIDPTILIDSLAASQLAFYRTLVGFPIFGEGWTHRVNARHAAALSMIKVA